MMVFLQLIGCRDPTLQETEVCVDRGKLECPLSVQSSGPCLTYAPECYFQAAYGNPTLPGIYQPPHNLQLWSAWLSVLGSSVTSTGCQSTTLVLIGP